jgi:hypothetical protein
LSIGEKIVFQTVQDLDVDGNDVILLATGKEGDIHYIYVLRDTENQIVNLSDDG